MRVSVPIPERLRDGVGSQLVLDDGRLEPHRAALAAGAEAPPVRLAYAAAHLILRDDYGHSPHRLDRQGAREELEAAIDFERTLAFRRHLAAQGFAIAEAMDTAQRFFLGWPLARRLVRMTGAARLPHGFIAGAGADDVPDDAPWSRIIDTVIEQAREIEAAGGDVILLPLVSLATRRATPETYVEVYRAIVAGLAGPVFLHWLGPMFHPALDGYFPGDSLERLLAAEAPKIRGLKLSMLDAELELRLRRSLSSRGQLLLTGDDWNFARLVLGGDPAGPVAAPAPTGTLAIGGRTVAAGDFSHALLGILDGIAVPAGLALRALARGDAGRYLELMAPCERLGRIVFEPRTQHYKAGLAFLAWLNGHQENFLLLNREELARTPGHYLRVATAASDAGALEDAPRAAARLEGWLATV